MSEEPLLPLWLLRRATLGAKMGRPKTFWWNPKSSHKHYLSEFSRDIYSNVSIFSFLSGKHSTLRCNFLDCAFNSYPDIQLHAIVHCYHSVYSVSGTRRDSKHSTGGGHDSW